MREIKFRAWDKTNEKWLRKPFYALTPYGGIKHWDKATSDWIDMHKTREKNIAIMQFTGFKDVVGNEVYEGDILFDGTETKHIEREVDSDGTVYDAADIPSFYYMIVEWDQGDGCYVLRGVYTTDYGEGPVDEGGFESDYTDSNWGFAEYVSKHEVVSNIYETRKPINE